VKRITSNSVSTALMTVLEDAENLDQVLILYRYKDSTEDNAHYAFHHNEDMTLESCNWLVDHFKAWVIGNFRIRESDD
jgi:hypothetical protein